jgi:hypothetical protein
MSHESFVDKCMRPLGLQLAKWKYSTKLAFFEFVKLPPTPEDLEAEAEAEAAKVKAEAGETVKEEEEEAAAASDDEGAEGAAAKKPTASAAKKPAAPLKKKRKGFQPAGIVLEGETRNNFSIAWRAD